MKCPKCDCELELSLVQKTYEVSTKEVINSQETNEQHGSHVVAKREITKSPDNIHQQNKELLDKDYESKLDKWKNKKITKPKIVNFASDKSSELGGNNGVK